MRMHRILGYSELFEGTCSNYIELINGTPTKTIVAYWSAINNILELRSDSIKTQAFIYRSISERFPLEIRTDIARKLARYQKKHGEFLLFTPRFITGFLFRLLINYNDFEQDIVPINEELNIFKAYLCYVDEVNNSGDEKVENLVNNIDYQSKNWFGELFWPYLIKQFEFTYSVDMLYEGIKGISFLTFLQKKEEYKPYISKFLSVTNITDPVQYVGGLMQLISANFKGKNRDKFSGYLQFFTFNPNEPVLSGLVYAVQNAKKHIDPEKSDYLNLKEKPIVYYEQNRYVVPYWGYVYQAMFLGLVFAFYRKSGVHKIKKKFDDFLSDIGSEFSEQHLFKKLLKKCFNHNYRTLNFPSSNESFNPDCYYRHGKNIYIFEFKDSLLNKDVIHSFSYQDIKSAIDKKLAQKGDGNNQRIKGIYQIARLVNDLTRDPVETLRFDQGLMFHNAEDAGKLTIYPIIVHTNKYFDLPGVNYYLQELLQEEITTVKSPFSSIKPLTVINLNYFFQGMQSFRDNKIQLHTKINNYHREVQKRTKKAEKTKSLNDNLNMRPSFAEIELNAVKDFTEYKRWTIVKSAFEALDLPGSKYLTPLSGSNTGSQISNSFLP